MRDECVYFTNSVSRGSRARLAGVSLQSLRSTIRQALEELAMGKKPVMAIDLVVPEPGKDNAARIIVVLDGDRLGYEIAGDNGMAAFLLAAAILLHELRAEIALCAYQDCHRGSLGRPRLFLQ